MAEGAIHDVLSEPRRGTLPAAPFGAGNRRFATRSIIAVVSGRSLLIRTAAFATGVMTS
jgi:hypothetical protein